MYLLLAFAYWWIEWRISTLTLVFFKALYHANPGAEWNFAGSSLQILNQIFLKSSQIHQLTITYHFGHTKHDIILNFLFQNL